jgi:hypothetical protein
LKQSEDEKEQCKNKIESYEKKIKLQTVV